MRKEAFFVDDFVHVYNRGNRKQELVRDTRDKIHFILALYYLNTKKNPDNPFRDLMGKIDIRFLTEALDSNKNILQEKGNSFPFLWPWPSGWPPRDPLVKILGFIIMNNHFHLLLHEISERGIATFMHKFSTSITNRFNLYHHEVGRLFQGPYKAKRVQSDNYLRYLCAYIQVKNAFDLYPGGLAHALQEFDTAYDFVTRYPYSSLSAYEFGTSLPVIDKDILSEVFVEKGELKEFSRNTIRDFTFNEKRCEVVFL